MLEVRERLNGEAASAELTFARIHTLGPQGTNCEAASDHWFKARALSGTTVLHRTLEEAAEAVMIEDDSALLGCVVYPDLHTLVFANLQRLVILDAFIMPTHPMVLASLSGGEPRTVSTHPAPQHLVPVGATRKLTTSNAQAARECAAGETEGCITTLVAARKFRLTVLRDFGPVPMGFTIHGRRRP